MIWKINTFTFNANTRVLKDRLSEVILKPKAAALLKYFCENSQSDVSRDDLIQHVWLGQIVSENAINRVIVELRKALNDNGKNKKVIVSVPSIGYRLTAEISSPEALKQNKLSSQHIWIMVVFSIIFFFGLYLYSGSENPSNQNRQSPLLRLSGSQFDGAISAKGDLAYSERLENGMSIAVKFNQQAIAQSISTDFQYTSFPVWSSRGDFLLFVGQNPEACSIIRLKIIDQKFSETEIIAPCMHPWVNSLTLDINDEIAYISSAKNNYKPLSVHALNINNGETMQVNQPEPKGLGHHHLDSNPYQSGSVLLLSDELPGKTSFYELDIEKETYQLISKLNYHALSASWAHGSNNVIHPGPHPAYELRVTDTSDDSFDIVVADSHRVSFPKRHPNGNGYLYTSYTHNTDIDTGENDYQINSSVIDYLPIASNDDSKIAFISKRTGYSELWVFNIKTKALESFKSPDQGRRFYDIQWSWNDRYILANTDSGVLLYDVDIKQSVKEWKTPGLLYGMNWYSTDQFNYSVNSGDEWKVKTQTISEAEPVDYLSGTGLILSNQNISFSFDSGLALMSDLNTGQCKSVLKRRRITWNIKDRQLYCISMNDEITSVQQEMVPTDTVPIGPEEFFDWLNGTVIKSYQVESNSDLMLVELK